MKSIIKLLVITTAIITTPVNGSLGIFNITASNGDSSNSTANGDIFIGTDLVGTFELTKVVLNPGSYGDTSFSSGTNGTLPTGTEETGLVANLSANNSIDSREDEVAWRLLVNTVTGYQVQEIIITDFLRNGLDGDTNQQNSDITATWVGGDGILEEEGDIIDLGVTGKEPGNYGSQGVINDGDTFGSGTVLHRDDPDSIYFATDAAWSLRIPSNEVVVSYVIENPDNRTEEERNSVPPVAINNNGFREQFGFQVDIVQIPESNQIILFATGLFSLLLVRTRKST